MKTLSRYLVGALAALALIAGAAYADTYYGWNPATLLETFHGTFVDASSDVPTIAQTGQTISAQKGGANVGTWVATGATTGAGTLTFKAAAPTGRFCTFSDYTTPADKLTQSTATDGKTVVTVAGTIVSGDQFGYQCDAF